MCDEHFYSHTAAGNYHCSVIAFCGGKTTELIINDEYKILEILSNFWFPSVLSLWTDCFLGP